MQNLSKTVNQIVLSVVGVVCVVSNGHASEASQLGKIEYESNCSKCHGLSAKGNGEMAKSLMSPPADLTTLAKQNKGIFPTQRIRNVIDGRSLDSRNSHGPREMPVWGNVFSADDGQPHELNVRNRIESLLEYLKEIQVK